MFSGLLFAAVILAQLAAHPAEFQNAPAAQAGAAEPALAGVWQSTAPEGAPPKFQISLSGADGLADRVTVGAAGADVWTTELRFFRAGAHHFAAMAASPQERRHGESPTWVLVRYTVTAERLTLWPLSASAFEASKLQVTSSPEALAAFLASPAGQSGFDGPAVSLIRIGD